MANEQILKKAIDKGRKKKKSIWKKYTLEITSYFPKGGTRYDR